MSQQNVEVFLRSALSGPDVAESEWQAIFTRSFHPDVRWVIAREHPASRTLVGYEEITEYLREWQTMLPDVRFEHDRVLDARESVLAIGRAIGTGNESGAEIAVPLALLCTIADGLIVRVEEFLNPDEALEAAGLAG